MLITRNDVRVVSDLESALHFREEVLLSNPNRAEADVEQFVTTTLKLIIAAAAVDEYLHHSARRQYASTAKRRLRSALDHVEESGSGTPTALALCEPAYVILGSFFALTSTSTRQEPGDVWTAALAALRASFGDRGVGLDAVNERIAAFARFQAEVEASQARLLWRHLNELDGDPVASAIVLPETDAIDVDRSLAALTTMPPALPRLTSSPRDTPLLSSLRVEQPESDLGVQRPARPWLARVPSPAGDAGQPGDRTGAEYQVWFATNRSPRSIGDSAGPSFSASFSQQVTTGLCVVRIPRAHRVGSLGRGLLPSILRMIGQDARLSVARREIIEGDALYGLLRDQISRADSRSALVYIHGFNTCFDDAAMRTAQIAYDLGFRGPAAFYSWPSKGQPWAYHADLRDADASVHLLADFLLEITRRTGVDKLHIIAHSMGNRIFGLALERIGNQGYRPSLGELVLAAPDLDRNLFGRLAKVYPGLASGTTLYVSGNDRALAMSGRLWAGPRVGITPPVTVADGIDTIDVSSVDLSVLGHGYVATHATVLADIASVLGGRRPPDARDRVSASLDGKHWLLS